VIGAAQDGRSLIALELAEDDEALFPTSAFSAPPKGQEGNLGRNTYSAPGYANVNLGVQPSFPLHFLGEAGKFELRGEFLNAFSRVNLTGPVGDLSNVNLGKSTGQFSARQTHLSATYGFKPERMSEGSQWFFRHLSCALFGISGKCLPKLNAGLAFRRMTLCINRKRTA